MTRSWKYPIISLTDETSILGAAIERPDGKSRTALKRPEAISIGSLPYEAPMMENDAMNASLAGKAEVHGPGPETPPEAQKSPGNGSESSSSAPGPRKRFNVTIKGSKELRCMGCNGFIGEVVGKVDKSRFLCHKCGMMNSFSFATAGY